ncbi:MAG: hypothetical protein Q4C03_05235 [bacterium]|nr:hypothetical protein [bacterium]
MFETDSRRWSLRNPHAEISNHNIPTAMLVQWARQGIIKPGFTLSTDGEAWIPAEALMELDMSWYIVSPDAPPYGPVTREAAEHFIAEGHFPEDATITQDPGNLPVTAELPLPIAPSQQETRQQELEDLRRRLVLTEKELKLKDRRIEELRKEAEVRQTELNVEGAPDIQTLSMELEALRLEHSHLRASAQEAAEHAATRENQLRQRIHTLETALETAQSQTATPTDESFDKNLYNILIREAEVLRQSQEEETRFLDQLRELAHQRLVQFSERLLAIRKLVGDSPEQMVANASHNARFQMPTPTLIRRQDDTRLIQLEQALADARARESDLQRQLVVQEGRETQLRAEIAQAERRTLNSLQLDEKLRETLQTLEREHTAREEEHRENAHIQEQLLRRIEELERLVATQDQPLYSDHAELTSALNENPSPQRSTFSWLRRR